MAPWFLITPNLVTVDVLVEGRFTGTQFRYDGQTRIPQSWRLNKGFSSAIVASRYRGIPRTTMKQTGWIYVYVSLAFSNLFATYYRFKKLHAKSETAMRILTRKDRRLQVWYDDINLSSIVVSCWKIVENIKEGGKIVLFCYRLIKCIFEVAILSTISQTNNWMVSVFFF